MRWFYKLFKVKRYQIRYTIYGDYGSSIVRIYPSYLSKNQAVFIVSYMSLKFPKDKYEILEVKY